MTPLLPHAAGWWGSRLRGVRWYKGRVQHLARAHQHVGGSYTDQRGAKANRRQLGTIAQHCAQALRGAERGIALGHLQESDSKYTGPEVQIYKQACMPALMQRGLAIILRQEQHLLEGILWARCQECSQSSTLGAGARPALELQVFSEWK